MGVDETKRHRETSFGPPSEIVRVNEFVGEASASIQDITKDLAGLWKKIKKPTRDHVQAELGLDELEAQTAHMMNQENLRNVLNQRYIDHAIQRKEHDTVTPPSQAESEGARLMLLLDQNPLTHWPPPKQSLYYFRKNNKTEENALTALRLTENGATIETDVALITISYYSRLTKASNRNDVWAHGYTLDATYAFLSTQTLQDVHDTLPCHSKDLPEEVWENGQLIGYNATTDTTKPLDGGIVMDRCAYGDGKSPWARHMVDMSKKSQTSGSIQETKLLKDTTLGDVDLRVQNPYWVLHQGNCLHCWVVDGIRLGNHSDSQEGYPIGLYLSKQPHPTCHHCGRNPVTLAINGDPRLGESPSRICETCWKIMGLPKVNSRDKTDGVLVVPCVH